MWRKKDRNLNQIKFRDPISKGIPGTLLSFSLVITLSLSPEQINANKISGDFQLEFHSSSSRETRFGQALGAQRGKAALTRPT